MGKRVIRTEFSRGEVVGALVWLSIFAAVGAVFCLQYLPATIELKVTSLPWTIPLAFGWCLVLVKTATLWSSNYLVQLLPTVIWVSVVWLMLPTSAAVAYVVGLVCAVLAGAAWPVIAYHKHQRRSRRTETAQSIQENP